MRTRPPRESSRACISSLAIATAIAARDMEACSIAARANTRRNAASASGKDCTRTNRRVRVKRPRRFATASNTASGAPSISRSIKLPSKPNSFTRAIKSDSRNVDAAQPAQTCQQNEEEIRRLLRSEAGQRALQTAKVDYQGVDRTIGQWSDADLANVAERSRQV